MLLEIRKSFVWRYFTTFLFDVFLKRGFSDSYYVVCIRRLFALDFVSSYDFIKNANTVFYHYLLVIQLFILIFQLLILT